MDRTNAVTNGAGRKLAARLAGIALAAGLVLGSLPAGAAGDAHAPKSPGFSFEGPFGTYDRAALQRGFQVFKEVCASCHSLKYIAFRNLVEIGFSEDQAKAIAAEYEVTDGPDEQGEMFQRPAVLSDRIPGPFANDNAARAANNGALPPDLSLIAKARAHGPDYLYSLLVGYAEPPADVVMGEGMNYNPYFGGAQIAMASPLFADGVTYADGTQATVDQMARDVSTFLMWAAEPRLEARKQMGIKVMIFLVLLTVLLYMTKKKIWRDVH
jgi:ubiquinol-cytochrome c reductase cytochrome c1 subunit